MQLKGNSIEVQEQQLKAEGCEVIYSDSFTASKSDRPEFSKLLTIAKQKPGFRKGRPNKFSKKQIEHALKLLETHSYTQVEELTGISRSTLTRELKEKLKKPPLNRRWLLILIYND